MNMPVCIILSRRGPHLILFYVNSNQGNLGEVHPRLPGTNRKIQLQTQTLLTKNAAEMADPSENSSSPNPKHNVKAVFEYEHVIEGFAGPEETAILKAVTNETELDNDEVEGIVTLTLPRNCVSGDTPREILQN